MSKGHANPAENEREGKDRRATVTQSRRVVKSTRNEDFEYDLHVISSAPSMSMLTLPKFFLAPPTKPRAPLTHQLAPLTPSWSSTTSSEIGVVKPEIGVYSLSEAAGVASDSHTHLPVTAHDSPTHHSCSPLSTYRSPPTISDALKFFELLKNASTSSRTRHDLLQCFRSKRLSSSTAKNAKTSCLLDGATYEQIVSPGILNRDPSIRDLCTEETRLPFCRADRWNIAKDAYSPRFGYWSEWKTYLLQRCGYDMPPLKILLREEAPAAVPVVTPAAQAAPLQPSKIPLAMD